MIRSLIAVLLLCAVFGAASADELRLCVYLDKGVTEAKAQRLVAAWNKREGQTYDLPVRIVQFAQWDRGMGTFRHFLSQHNNIPDGCDRNVGLMGRDAGQILTALSMLAPLPIPEVMGTANGSHMVSRASWGSLNQLWSYPAKVFRHELRHTLGCGHGTMYKDCSESIAKLRAARTGDLFPIMYPIMAKDAKKHGQFIATDRYAYNTALYNELSALHAAREDRLVARQ